MIAPILATKLYIPPPRPNLVQRSRLIKRLNEGLSAGCKLALISAPAGFGKTTLVSEWISGCGRSVAWLSLDEGDNDQVRFLSYLVAALQTIKAGIGEDLLAVLQSPQPPQSEAILTTLLNEISVIPKQFILILDDYHLIDSQPVDHALAFLIEHLPPLIHLVIVTREDPDLPLARLRARSQLTEIRAADLRFTPAEAAEFLNHVMGLNLTDGDIAALETRTEGWIAGLQLAALSMQGRLDIAGFIQAFSGSHRFVLDYLVEEVLERQPEQIQSFLLQTAILDRLCASLCNAVTEREDSKDMLEILEHSNLFLIPLDDKRQWYRYHRIFADVLQTRSMEAQANLVTTLHSRASGWHEKNGLPHEAIRHALAARDFERVATLVELAAPEIRRNRQGGMIMELGWLKALPDELVRFRPVLCVAYAYALFAGGELEAAEARLRDAERWLDTPTDTSAGMIVVDEEEFRHLPGMIALLRAARALARGDMPETAKNARRVLDLAPRDDHLMLGGAASQLGLAAWASGDLNAARQMTADGMQHVRLAGYISPAIGAAITLADIQIAQGDLHEAMTTFEQGLRWATKPGAPFLRGAADMYVGMSTLYYEHNDLQTATQYLLTSQSLGELAGLPQNPYRWCSAMARIRQAQGDLDGALDLLDQAGCLYDANFSPNVRPIAARKARVWVAQGRLDKALSWAHEQGLSVENEISYLREFDAITLARILIAQYKNNQMDGFIHEAMGLLERLLKAAEERREKGSVIEILVLQAISFHAQDDLPAAFKMLQKAVTLAEPEGYIRLFLDEGPRMAELLSAAAAQGIRPEYIHKLLVAFEAEPDGKKPAPVVPGTSSLVEPLSPRELEVLGLIAQGLSNQEICKRLFLALDTVKGHNRRIFEKLQVKRRTEAIARARELGLI